MAEEQDSEGLRRLLIGIVLLACVAALEYSVATDANLREDFGRDPGPAFQPILMLRLIGAGAVILVFDGIYRMWRRHWRVAASFGQAARLAYPAAMIASLIAYVLLVPHLGFLAMSVAFSVIWGMALAAQDSRRGDIRRPLASGAGSALVALAIYLIFEKLIGIPLG